MHWLALQSKSTKGSLLRSTSTMTVGARTIVARSTKALVRAALLLPSQRRVLLLLVAEASPNLQTSLQHLAQAQHPLQQVKVIDVLRVSDVQRISCRI
jgi:hypothetical protein